MRNATWWMTFRVIFFLAGISLVGYVAYRYTLFSPPDHGSLYGKVFPLALPFALLAMLLAVRPRLFEGLSGQAGLATRSVTTVFAGVWMATGLMCAASFSNAIVAAPLGGTFDMVHMLSDHVFLPVAIVALAWAPARVARWMGAVDERPARIAEPAWGAITG